MSTIDLRNKIDSILGNSMRVLLPSYWWKRAFNVTADAIDTIETDTQEKIGEVQQQVDKLAEKMTEKRVLYADNPQDHKEENLAMINTLWGEHLFGRGHDPVYLVTEDGVWLSPNFTVQSNHIYFYNVPRKNTTGTTRQKLYTYHIYDKAGGEVVIEISDSFEHYVNQSSQNAVQSSAVYTAMQTKQDKLVSGSNIKTVNGQSILGAGNITIEGGSNITVDTSLSSTSTNPLQNKVVTAELAKKQDKLVSGTSIKTINGTTLLGSGDIKVAADVTIDSYLSSSSTNPVQNKVVTEALATKQDKITDLDAIRSGAAKGATALQSVPSEYVTESELIAKGYATTSQVNSKQDKINDLETIRSGATLGASALQSHQDISHLATKEDVLAFVNEFVANEEVYAAAVNDLNARVNSNYLYGEDTYVTKEAFNTAVQAINTAILDNEEVIAATLADLNAQITALRTQVESLTNVE